MLNWSYLLQNLFHCHFLMSDIRYGLHSKIWLFCRDRIKCTYGIFDSTATSMSSGIFPLFSSCVMPYFKTKHFSVKWDDTMVFAVSESIICPISSGCFSFREFHQFLVKHIIQHSSNVKTRERILIFLYFFKLRPLFLFLFLFRGFHISWFFLPIFFSNLH